MAEHNGISEDTNTTTETVPENPSVIGGDGRTYYEKPTEEMNAVRAKLQPLIYQLDAAKSVSAYVNVAYFYSPDVTGYDGKQEIRLNLYNQDDQSEGRLTIVLGPGSRVVWEPTRRTIEVEVR